MFWLKSVIFRLVKISGLFWLNSVVFNTDILDGIPAAGEGEDRALLAHPQDAVPPDSAA